MNKDELVFDTLESILKTENLKKEYSNVHELFVRHTQPSTNLKE